MTMTIFAKLRPNRRKNKGQDRMLNKRKMISTLSNGGNDCLV